MVKSGGDLQNNNLKKNTISNDWIFFKYIKC